MVRRDPRLWAKLLEGRGRGVASRWVYGVGVYPRAAEQRSELRERASEDHGGETKVITGGAAESASERGDGRRASGAAGVRDRAVRGRTRCASCSCLLGRCGSGVREGRAVSWAGWVGLFWFPFLFYF